MVRGGSVKLQTGERMGMGQFRRMRAGEGRGGEEENRMYGLGSLLHSLSQQLQEGLLVSDTGVLLGGLCLIEGALLSQRKHFL